MICVWWTKLIVISLTCVRFGVAFNLPCHFLDSINITAGISHDNGSITFNDTLFDKDQYAEINYILENGEKKITVDPYIRGCVCILKPCIRLCCPLGQFFNRSIDTKCQNDVAARYFKADILDENNTTVQVILDEHFAHVDDKICTARRYRAEPYIISHTGGVLYDNEFFSHQNYCIAAEKDADNSKLNVLVCYDYEDEPKTRLFGILPYGMLISVPFIILTLLVYICLPELRNLHGKCLACYLISLALGYTLLAWVQLNGAEPVGPFVCKSIGYLIYFSFLSVFLWLSVICMDLWWNFRFCILSKKSVAKNPSYGGRSAPVWRIVTDLSSKKPKGLHVFVENIRLILYMMYAWGVSLSLTLTAYMIDAMQYFSEKFRPGIGIQTCFLKRSSESQFIYFYMPLCIICTVNITFFVLTAREIYHVQTELKKMTSQEECSRHQNKLNKDKDNFTLYLRLFIIMGVTWVMEGISFVISPQGASFILTDICNTIQGVFIFILFVLKRRVLFLIKKRWDNMLGKTTACASTATSSISATHTNVVLNDLTSSKDNFKNPS